MRLPTAFHTDLLSRGWQDVAIAGGHATVFEQMVGAYRFWLASVTREGAAPLEPAELATLSVHSDAWVSGALSVPDETDAPFLTGEAGDLAAHLERPSAAFLGLLADYGGFCARAPMARRGVRA